MTDMEKTVFERGVYYLQSQEKGAWQAMQGHMGRHQDWSGGRKSKEKTDQRPLWCLQEGVG